MKSTLNLTADVSSLNTTRTVSERIINAAKGPDSSAFEGGVDVSYQRHYSVLDLLETSYRNCPQYWD